jgi:hypothetical protein
MPALGRFAVPFGGAEVILRDAPAFAKHLPKLVLRFAVTLFGRFAKPQECFGIIPSHSVATEEFQAQSELCFGHTLKGCFLVPLECFQAGLEHAIARLTHSPKSVLSEGISFLSLPPDIRIIRQAILAVDAIENLGENILSVFREALLRHFRSIKWVRIHDLTIGTPRNGIKSTSLRNDEGSVADSEYAARCDRRNRELSFEFVCFRDSPGLE